MYRHGFVISEVYHRFVTVDGIAILCQFIRGNIENHYTVVRSEVFGICFYFGDKIIHDSLRVPNFIYRVLKSDCTIAFQHLGEVGAHLVVCDIVTNYNHLT